MIKHRPRQMIAMLLKPFVGGLRIIIAHWIRFTAVNHLNSVFVFRCVCKRLSGVSETQTLFGFNRYVLNELGDSVQVATIEFFEIHAVCAEIYWFGGISDARTAD